MAPKTRRVISRFALAFTAAGLASSGSAQELVSTRGKVRVFKSGLIVEGKNLQVTDQSVSLEVHGQTVFMDLSEIERADVRKDRMMLGACIGGGGCMAISMLACSAADESAFPEGSDRGQCFVGGMIWSALFAAGGALLGNSSSRWEMIYYRRTSSLDKEENNRLTFVIIPMHHHGWRAGLAYRY